MDTHDPSSAHRRAWDAIPWLVAGSASAPDRALLQQHLPQCEECRAELHFQQQVQAGLHAGALAGGRAGGLAHTPPLADPEPGLQRLLARIDAAESIGTEPDRRAARNPSWTRWLAAAVVVQAVGLGAAGVALMHQQSDGKHEGGGGGDGGADFRTLSQPAPAAAAATLRLVPAPGMDFATLRQLLADTHLAVVDTAPDASSIGLAPLDGDAHTTAAALPRLRSLPGVLMAEPTGRAR